MRAMGFLSIAVLVVLGGSELAQAQDYEWSVQATLLSGPSLCGFGRHRDISIKDNVFVAKSETGATWTVKNLSRLLKPDGSGEVVGKTFIGNHKVFFKFSPGTGPRPITYRAEDSACVWQWAP